MLTRFFCTYLLGPFAALLPLRWRNKLPFADRVHWEHAAALSGLLELLAAMIGLGYWYLYVMPVLFGSMFDAATSGAPTDSVTEFHLRGAAWILFMLQPVTWLLFYSFFEGAVRMCGALFTENVLGIIPLFLIERTLYLIRNRKELRPGEVLGEHASSVVDVLRERLMVARLENVPDELHPTQIGAEDWLEIRASRRKDEWIAPRIVRVDDLYYRLEENSVETGPRPFRYRLRRLEAGVPGRRVLLYKTADAVVKD